jgi:16S rRNA processing protein RimM
VGRAHGLDGSFYVDSAEHGFPEGTELDVGGQRAVVERRAGTDARPIVRVSGIGDRAAAEALRGQALVAAVEADAGEADGQEWEVAQLVGCEVPGVGTVRRVMAAPSCDVLEVGDEGVLVPLVSDAIRSVDVDARTIEVDRRFLGLQ